MAIRVLAFILLWPIAAIQAFTTDSLSIETGLDTYASTGSLAPYYMAANKFGTLTQGRGIAGKVNATATHSIGRWHINAGIGLHSRVTNATAYERFAGGEWTSMAYRPQSFWLQQAYLRTDYRCLRLCVGLKQEGSALLNDSLSSGDVTWSANSRPMPGVRAGFNDFQPLPFTEDWVWITGVLFFGFPTDSQWLANHYNYYSDFLTTHSKLSYKHMYFRTKPSLPLSLTIGLQASVQFGGILHPYYRGQERAVQNQPCGLREWIGAVVPMRDEQYVTGNTVGSCDIMARYRLDSGAEVKAYLQWPWEDGSGIARLNGVDGLWGVEYRPRQSSCGLTALVVEYLDFTNQSGPLHWDPEDNPGTSIIWQATGSDSYYNNYAYNGYAYYGLSIGTPMLRSPLYNRDGYMRYADTRVRGVHIAAMGRATHTLSWRAMTSWRTSLGDTYSPRLRPVHALSAMGRLMWHPTAAPRLTTTLQVAADLGSMYDPNVGAMLSLTYRIR